ncbi:hypothetical protein TCON_2779 [Astathelohania contejeani]|uniref:Uncharacterized protein n=1 Tax=Astathelohania contejeani TaxID=164912 RepID=A0ABQ7HV18_9MICR|nr:hypothetical protein TCON_2779 [Thelohania contejeani]
MQFLNIHLISMILYSISFTRGTEDNQSDSYVYLIKKDTNIDDIKNDSIKIGEEEEEIGSEIRKYFKSKNGELSPFIQNEKFERDTLLILVDNKKDNDYNKVNEAISSLKECVIKIKNDRTMKTEEMATFKKGNINIHCADVSKVDVNLKDELSSLILIRKKNDKKMFDNDGNFNQLTSINFKDNDNATKFTAIFYKNRAVISSEKTTSDDGSTNGPSSGNSGSEHLTTTVGSDKSPSNGNSNGHNDDDDHQKAEKKSAANGSAPNNAEPVDKTTNLSSKNPESATSSVTDTTTSAKSNADTSNGTANPPKDEISFWSEWWVYILVAGIILAIAIAGFILFKVFSSK